MSTAAEDVQLSMSSNESSWSGNWSVAADQDLVAYTPLQAALIGTSAGLLSFVTIVGNLMVMISFKMDKQLQTISNYFLFSLAVADLIIGAISMPLFTVYVIQKGWTFGRAICDSWLSVDYWASNSSVLNLLVISFDRYFSVTRPLTYRVRRTTKKAALMIFSAWAVSAVVWPPSIVAWPYIEGARTVPANDCYVQFIYTNEYMSIVTVVIAFWLPVSVMIVLYVRVWYETVKRQRELVHLQAGKRVSSKRSDSSDETMEDAKGGNAQNRIHSGKSRALAAWKSNKQTTSNRSKESQEITYVPTAILTNSATETEANAQASPLTNFLVFCKSCIDPEKYGAGEIACGAGTEEQSSEGYMTPRSVETPIPISSKCSSLNPIRDPFASRLPSSLRQHNHDLQKKHAREKQQLSTSKFADQDHESIYTILIKLPVRNAGSNNSSRKDGSSSLIACAEVGTSIKMLSDREGDDVARVLSCPPIRKCSDPSSGKCRTSKSTLSVTTPSEVSKFVAPNTRLVPRPIVRETPTTASAIVAAAVGVKKVVKNKKSSEKKQERKAAKTLSAILLAFIVTWTPYSVLVVLNGCLGKQLADKYIPQIVWRLSYYLCYINSTINPVLYALCNAAFRRTYVRILTCRWSSHHRQPFNRYHFN